MPSVRITNYTQSVLNLSLKHICAIHFENEVQPGQTIKLVTGKVWFTIEAQVDDEDNRYSLAKSAMTIGLVSLAAVATVAAAGAPLLVAGAGASVGGAATAAGSTIFAGLTAAAHVGKSFIIANAGTAAKISTALLPKAIEAVSNEIGGFTEVQKEVATIISSPEELKTAPALSTLERLRKAHSSDRKKAREERESASGGSTSGKSDDETVVGDDDDTDSMKGDTAKKSWTIKWTLRDKTKEEKEPEKMEEISQVGVLSDKKTLRVHGVSTWERRVFEIREKDGKMELFDAINKIAYS